MTPTRELVQAKAMALFPEEQRDTVLAELDRYPGDTTEGRARVQLAILRLSEGDLGQLREWVGVALRDFRDVLAPAEFPQQTAVGFAVLSRMSEADRAAVVRADREQWLAWLAS